jgi:hypothetical protein
MKEKPITRKRQIRNLDAFMAQVPIWASKLDNGTLFGQEKDGLILEILELGGMKLIESKCGMRFVREGDHPNCEPAMEVLLAIRRELIEEQAASASSLAQYAKHSANRDIFAEKGGVIHKITVLRPKRGK